MKLKRITALFMSALLAMGTLSACGGGNEDSGETGSKEGEESVSTEGVTISIFDKNSGSNTFDDPVAEAIMEKTGVTIQVENPSGDPLEKLNLMLTG